MKKDNHSSKRMVIFLIIQKLIILPEILKKDVWNDAVCPFILLKSIFSKSNMTNLYRGLTNFYKNKLKYEKKSQILFTKSQISI